MLNNDQLVNRQVVVLELDCDVNQLILQCVNKELELAAMRASGADYVLAKMKQNHLVPRLHRYTRCASSKTHTTSTQLMQSIMDFTRGENVLDDDILVL